MNFVKALPLIVSGLDAAGVSYAVIGGFALALHGVQRATLDLDFILLLQDLDKADALFAKLGYRREFRSENVSHYLGAEREWGRIDVLHAFRSPSLGMLQRAELVEIDRDLRVRVAQIEDIIGLKVQALTNDPSRAVGDWNDILLLLQAAGSRGQAIDWELLNDYLRIFRLEAKLPELKAIHGQTD